MTLEQTVAITEIMNTETVLSMRDKVALDDDDLVILDLGRGRTIKIDADGTKLWYLNGKLHRADGPAVEYVNGSKFWYLNGQRHRADGPAEEWANGTKRWWFNGQRHRLDGPVKMWADGIKNWFLGGK